MKFSRVFSIIAIGFAAASLSASPKINFDKKTYDFGMTVEGKTKIVSIVFKVKNTGDSPLRIEKVRPSCPCVSVRYDSLIEPGKTGRIEPFVDTKGFRSGPWSKFVMVASNAKDNPSVKLTVTGHFQATIDVSSRYLSFNTATGKIRDTFFLATKKNDLQILGVEFQSADPNIDKSDWKTEIPLAIGFKGLPRDSTRAADGYNVFRYEFIAPSVKQSQEGWLIIRTNHPDKPEVVIQGNILK